MDLDAPAERSVRSDPPEIGVSETGIAPPARGAGVSTTADAPPARTGATSAAGAETSTTAGISETCI